LCFCYRKNPHCAFGARANLLFTPDGRKKKREDLSEIYSSCNKIIMTTVSQKPIQKPALSRPKNKGGRPKAKVRRDQTLRIRINATELYMVKTKAREAGMRASTWIRQAAKAARIAPRWTPEQMELLRMLTGMANNLNQLARQANSGKLLFIVRKCESLLAEIDDTLKYLNNHDGQDREIRKEL
jgi:hypothetical protein